MRELGPVFSPATPQDAVLTLVRSLLDAKFFMAFNELSANTIGVGGIADNGDRLHVSLMRDATEPEILAAIEALKDIDKSNG